MPEFGNFALHFPDGSQFVFRNACAVREDVTAIDLKIRVLTRAQISTLVAAYALGPQQA